MSDYSGTPHPPASSTMASPAALPRARQGKIIHRFYNPKKQEALRCQPPAEADRSRVLEISTKRCSGRVQGIDASLSPRTL